MYTKVDVEPPVTWYSWFALPATIYTVHRGRLLFVSVFRLRMRWRHTQNLAPLLPPQLSADDTVDARADGVSSLADEDAGVVVELDDAAVGALHLLPRADDNGVSDVPALYLVRRRGGTHTGIGGTALLLDDSYYAVAYRGEEAGSISASSLLAEKGGEEKGRRQLLILLAGNGSPMDACRFRPTTRAHSTMAAPELSMQFSIVCGIEPGY